MEDERVTSWEASELEAWNRRALDRARREMLSMIPFLAERELSPAALADPSAFFSVSYTDRELFPRFQFADDGRPYSELKVILQHLPDRRGWDRLAWFLSRTKALPAHRPSKSGGKTGGESSKPQWSSTGRNACDDPLAELPPSGSRAPHPRRSSRRQFQSPNLPCESGWFGALRAALRRVAVHRPLALFPHIADDIMLTNAHRSERP
jgi:hypothetical protein